MVPGDCPGTRRASARHREPPEETATPMKLFECQVCGNALYFENIYCEACDAVLGFVPGTETLSALAAEGDGRWHALATPGSRHRFCANAEHGACNWLIPEDNEETRCSACRLNRTIPDLSQPENWRRWHRLELGKHRLVYSLIRLGLPLANKADDPDAGLAFDFLADPGPTFREGERVMTGHAQGLITINLGEADDAERERHRQDMAEPYRTLLGHFRHEIGHYYWERLVRDGSMLDPFRTLFGDERENYGTALQEHYAAGPPDGWAERYVSAYAAAHPWEDWAETFAHCLHIVDTLETAQAFGVRIEPGTANGGRDLATGIDFDPYDEPDFDVLVRAWLPLTYAVNSLNRSMGQPDLYPFVLPPAVIEKLRFVHGALRAGRNTAVGQP